MDNPSLAEQILAFGNLQAAWRYIRKRAPAFGLDGQSVQDFEKRSGVEIRKLAEQLQSGSYVPQPLLGYSIPKDSDPTKRREISIVAIRDRVAQQAFRQIIDPIWDQRFLDSSYGWRRGRSVRSAIEAARDCVRGGNHWVVSADIKDCFSNLKPALVLQQTAKWTGNDIAVVSWVDMWMRSGRVLHGRDWTEAERGIPQGMGIAPLLANRYLHELDVHAAAEGWVFLRFGDDMRLFTRTRQDAERRVDELRSFVEERLQLSIKHQNQHVYSVSDGVPFLGVVLRGVSAHLPEGKWRRDIGELRSLLPQRMDQDATTLDERIQRWRSYYWSMLSTESVREFDGEWAQWVAVRIREWSRGGARERSLRKWLSQRQWPFPSDQTGRTRRAQMMAKGDWELTDPKVREYAAGRELDLKKQGIAPKATQPAPAKRRLAQQRRKFEKRRLNESISVISGPVKLVKSGKRLLVRRNGKTAARINLDRCEHILLLSHTGSITIQALDAICMAQVQVDRVDWRSEPIGSISPPTAPHSARALSQLRYLEKDESRSGMAASIISAKIRGQYNLVKYYLKSEPELAQHARTTERLVRMATLRKELEAMSLPDDWVTARSIVLGHEGAAAAIYWSLVRELLEDHIEFPGRKGRGARDPVNSSLNYCYAIVATQATRVIRKVGLVPELGVLHEGKPSRPALVYDFLEEYRAPVADRVVFSHVRRGMPLECSKGGRLSEGTRKALAQSVMERLYLTVPWRGKRRSTMEILTSQVRDFAAICNGSTKSYRGFTGRY